MQNVFLSYLFSSLVKTFSEPLCWLTGGIALTRTKVSAAPVTTRAFVILSKYRLVK